MRYLLAEKCIEAVGMFQKEVYNNHRIIFITGALDDQKVRVLEFDSVSNYYDVRTKVS